MSIVDGPESNSNLEVTHDTISSNIRETFNRQNIEVYVFKDRAEIRGLIPSEIIDIPREADKPKWGPIICSARG
jgi:hypothetical protein